MSISIQTAIWAVSVLIALKIFTTIRTKFAYHTAMQKRGCLEATQYPEKDFVFGIDLFITQMKNYQQGTLLQMLTDIHKVLGNTYQAHIWGSTYIRTIEPRNAQALFASNFEDFGLGPLRYDIAAPFMGKGIFTTDGTLWESSRALIRPTFSRVQLANLSALETHVDNLLALIPRDKSTVDLAALFGRLVLDSSTEFLFGKSLGSLLPSAPADSQLFLDAFNIAGAGLEKRAMLGIFRAFYRSRQWNDAIRFIHSYIDSRVDEALKSLTSEKGHEEAEGELTGRHHILLNEMAKQTQDRGYLRYQILNVFVPAQESMGIAVSNVFFLLSRNKRVWRTLRAEILTLGSTPLTFDNLKSLTYLRYVLNETHRLLPVIPLNSRVCLKDSVLPTGGGSDGKAPVFVTKGTLVSANIYAMHRSKEFWGDDAEEFKPERWATARPGWAYLPFIGGPRICPAQQMVLVESSYVIARLLREFEDIESRDSEPWTELLKVTVKNRNGVKVALIP